MASPLPGKTYIVEEGVNPSTDYFVLPQLLSTRDEIIRCTWHDLPKASDLSQATVIFIRYVPKLWQNLITQSRTQLNRLIYFMDDDLFDFEASQGLSLSYRYKLLRHATLKKKWLHTMQAELWVSSDWLFKKYAALAPNLLLPQPIASQNESLRVFYHGSASHYNEIVWLYPVIKVVLERDPKICFELIGNSEVNRLYRGLPRVTVVHPMKWLSYQSFITAPGRHVGLAPLLNSAFNQARSYTKFFDITRANAVGIYAELGPIKNILTHRHQGLLVQMTHSAWIDAILQLSHQDTFRQQMLLQAKCLVNLFDKKAVHSKQLNIEEWK